MEGDRLGEGNWGVRLYTATTSTACTSTAVAGHRHGRRVRCIGLDVVDAVFRHTASDRM